MQEINFTKLSLYLAKRILHLKKTNPFLIKISAILNSKFLIKRYNYNNETILFFMLKFKREKNGNV